MQNKWYSVVGMTVVVLITTYLIKLPIPGSVGYFNFGDVVIVFAALMLGRKGGFLAGAIGASIADIISGFAMWAPLTFVAKGLEGFLCGFAKGKKGIPYHIYPLIGTIIMAAVYFVGEYLIPNYGGPASAVAELIPNIIQAGGGYIGGKILFEMYVRIFEEN